ncbi:toll/interleukin-1 receptor domain-containing protein [Anaerovorax odorimutans]|uniref:toll/interleukin-1 receptor domain-containing protein n=1 Tax=Anaerovorax odorimutans TaxID=109327 RepID=UPI000404441E|nr:toll/interleukin-1 receptor domain-containing protein [Anaerovorax odorimutans]
MSTKVFVSYSWDSMEHEEWVLGLVADLRRAGISATLDKAITQSGTVNLDRMMIEGFKDNDKVVMVLTEKYAEKADQNLGGVGFETLLSIPILKSNSDKLIFISRHKSSISVTLPFHLKSYYSIDFSDDGLYFDKISELIYKIREVNMHELPPVAEVPELIPKRVKGNLERAREALIPNLAEYNKTDKEGFLATKMQEIWNVFTQLSKMTKGKNSNFSFDVIVDTPTEKMIYFYINRDIKTGIHMRLHDMFGSTTQIVLSYGTRFTQGSSNSFNEMISCEVNSSNELELSGLTMAFSGRKSKEPKEIAETIWKDNVVQGLKY